MALVTFKDLENPFKISLLSHAVPALVGDFGIGKTQWVKSQADAMSMHFITIECALLKEGEIGGLPYITEDARTKIDAMEYIQKAIAKMKTCTSEDDRNKVLALMDKKLKEYNKELKSTLVYATHYVLKQILAWTQEDPNKGIILFMDEFNRPETPVMQELMNIILNREINGIKIPDNVYVVLAMNPSNKFTDFKNSTYITNDLDPAQLDRLRPFFIKADPEVWLNWATAVINEETGETRIAPEICEFIASNPEVLSVPDSTDDICPSARSWERLSDSYKVWKTFKGASKADLGLIARGDLGTTVALQFTQFLENCDNPLIKAEEVFEQGYKKLPEKLLKQYAGESLPRMLMTMKNLIRYCLKNNKKYATNLPLLVQMITAMPRDMMVMTMATILNDHYALHNKLIKYSDYLDAFSNLDLLID